MPTDTDDELENRVLFGPARIQTAEDARVAYLREEIDEDELDKILARFGQSKEGTGLVFGAGRAVNRIDEAFKRTLPEEDPALQDTVVDRLGKLVDKAEERADATKNNKTTFATQLVSDAPIKGGPDTTQSNAEELKREREKKQAEATEERQKEKEERQKKNRQEREEQEKEAEKKVQEAAKALEASLKDSSSSSRTDSPRSESTPTQPKSNPPK